MLSSQLTVGFEPSRDINFYEKLTTNLTGVICETSSHQGNQGKISGGHCVVVVVVVVAY